MSLYVCLLTGVGWCEFCELSLFNGRPDCQQASAKTSTVSLCHVPRDLLASQQVAGARCWPVDEPGRAPAVTMVTTTMMMMMTCCNEQLLLVVAFTCIPINTFFQGGARSGFYEGYEVGEH